MKSIFITLFLCYFLIPPNGFGQSNTIQEIRDSNQVQLGLFFSPSTLRMLNVQNDTSYNDMIRGIKKMNLLILKPNNFTTNHFYRTAEKLAQEGYEEYIILDGNEYDVQVYGKAKTHEMIGLAEYNERHYIFRLKGTIDLTKLPEIYEKMTTQDSTMQNGFLTVFNMIKQNEDRRVRSEQRRKEWEERRRKDEEDEQLKIDSLRADSLLNENKNKN